MMKLYSNGCPKCLILKQKLSSKSISYEEIDDVDFLIKNGFIGYPVLQKENMELLDYLKAINYINGLEKA